MGAQIAADEDKLGDLGVQASDLEGQLRSQTESNFAINGNNGAASRLTALTATCLSVVFALAGFGVGWKMHGRSASSSSDPLYLRSQELRCLEHESTPSYQGTYSSIGTGAGAPASSSSSLTVNAGSSSSSYTALL